MIVARFWSVDLFWLLPAALSGRLVTGLWTFVICHSHVPLTTRPALDRSLIKSLFSFGGWVTVSSIVSPILTTFDRFIISLIGGPTAVTYYGVPFGIVSRLLVLPTALSGAVFPRFANGDAAARQQLLVQSTGALAAVFTPVSLGMIFLIGPFLSVWVGSELASKGTLVGELMIVGFWFNGLGFLPHAFLQANARPRISAVFHLAELAPYLLLLWLGLKLWGVAGAALAGSLRMIADTVLHFWASGRGGAVWRELVVPTLAILAGLGTVMAFDAADLRRWLAAAGLFCVIAVWGWGRLPEVWRQRFSFPMLRKNDA
jgi:O-antigen/teichoic acid export membrane protein